MRYKNHAVYLLLFYFFKLGHHIIMTNIIIACFQQEVVEWVGFGEVYIFRWDAFCLINVSKQSIYHSLTSTGIFSTV